MAMTRKDYVNLATAMGMQLRSGKYDFGDVTPFASGFNSGMQEMVEVVAEALNRGNANFDYDRFMQFTMEVADRTRDAEGRKVKGKAA